MRLLALSLLILFVVAARPWPAAAQGGTPAVVRPGVVTVPLQELPNADSLDERARGLWEDFLDLFDLGQSSSHYIRRSREIDRGHARMRDDFSELMEIAGYRLSEIESTAGLVPGMQMVFGLARELTEADREFVERHLARHARRYSGPLAAIQRTIVRSIVEASDIGGFSVEKVAIELFPLPQVKLVLLPTDAPPGIDAARIMRAIDGLNRKLQQVPNQRSGLAPPLTNPGRPPLPAGEWNS